MKRKYILLAAVLGVGLGLSSCADQLDADRYFKDRMRIEDVFSDRDYTEEWLASAFDHLTASNADVSSKGHTMYCFADDMYFGDRDDKYKRWKNGEYNEDWEQGPWGSCYEGIRQASIFIQHIDQNLKFTEEERADLKAQARFVRAYYYWLLLRKYGPVPLLPEEGLDYTKDYADLAIGRNTYDECADFIASEMQLAAKDLQLRRGANQIARPTRGAALATRAKVLLYAASPINNPRPGDTEKFADMVDRNGRNLISQVYDEKKWARAAAAALDVMKLEGGNRYSLYFKAATAQSSLGYPATLAPYNDGNFSTKDWPNGYRNIDPYESYRALFNGSVNASDNPELIFTRGQNQSTEGINVMVRHQLPRVANGWNTHGMTQKQCDAYYMKDGSDCPGKDSEYSAYPAYAKRIDSRPRAEGFVTGANKDQYPELGEHREGISMQYVGREPRFYASVAYSGSTWYLLNEPNSVDKNKQVFYYRGDGNGYTNTMFWLRTGIGVMKFVHPDDTNRDEKDERIRKKAEPAIRFAEILLIYAEALNELSSEAHIIASWDGETQYTIKRDVDEMKKGIQPIRIRAGVPDYTPEEYNKPDVFREKLKRERQIELMGEGHRYYDIRRWKDADVEEVVPIYGCNTLMTEKWRDLFYVPMAIPSLPTNFSRKMYFWPIGFSELKRNALLTQNPGWMYND